NPDVAADFGEVRVLGEETVPWVDRIDAEQFGRANDAGDVQVAVPGGRGPDAEGFVGEPDMHRPAVGIRIHGHRPYAQFAAGADDSHRDLASVRDEPLGKWHTKTLC